MTNLNPIQQAAKSVQKGHIIIAPTETIYGLSCDATNSDAVEKIIKIKDRPKDKGLVVLVKNLKMLKEIAKVPKEKEKILQKIWPGPVTCVFETKEGFLPEKVQSDGTVAVRVSSHPFFKVLFQSLNKPVVSTSANISGEKPLENPNQLKEVFQENSEDIDLLIDWGKIENKKPSTIIDLTVSPPECVREGQIPCSNLKELLS